jgi:hypothetical protein
VSYAHDLIADYFKRTGQAQDSALDGAYRYHLGGLRDILSRLEVILDDEGVPRETAQRVMRCLLYGVPSVADAELRMRQQEEMVRLISSTPIRHPFTF